jgi:endogenous inhibitor of DNA gyrase (YacG/DUF329 family)
MSDRKSHARGPRCPICNEPTAIATRPFCSRRCADIDLGRWFSGAYAIPVIEPSEEDLDALESLAQSGESDGDERE